MTSRVQLKRKDAASKDSAASIKAAALIVASGLLISVYSVALRQMALRAGSEDCVRAAAQYVAGELRKVAVDDLAFGEVGLCDADVDRGDLRTRITSLNRIYATLRLDDIISKQLQMPVMSRMVAADFEAAKKLDEELRHKLELRAKDSFKRAYELAAARNRSNEKLVRLEIKLGALNAAEFQSGMPATTTVGEDARLLDIGGKYPAGVDVPISGGGTAKFYQLANETRFVDESKFVEAKPGVAPSVVLISAEFEVASHKGTRTTIPRSVAIMLGGASAEALQSVMVFGFPQGMPKTFHSLGAVIAAAGAGATTNAAWQQASDGNVPGDGHFDPATKYRFEGGADMPGGSAIQVAVYHWLRSLGPKLNLNAVNKLFNSSWAAVPMRSLETAIETPLPAGPNSALTKDTGSRARAFFFQSGPGSDGQRVLKTAFEATPNQQALPSSAVPLDIDDTGRCNVPGHNGFDQKLVADLLEAVYETNLIANESMGTAKSIINRMERTEESVRKSIDLATEELHSISTRRTRIESSTEPSAELKRLQKSETDLTAQINQQRAKLVEFDQVRARADAVAGAAESAAQASFDLCANMLNYAEEGIFRAPDGKSFLLGGVYVFHPVTRSVTEDEIYKGKAPDILWIGTQPMSVLEPAPEREAIECKVARNQSASSEQYRAMPRFAIFDSRELSSNDPQLLVLDRSPFSDTGVPVGQLSFYQGNALITGQNPPVGWSLLVRDVVASRAMGGEPLRSRFSQWCLGESRAMSECPGVAVEIQVRSPLPVIPDLPVGSFIVNPSNHDRVSQIPPTPSDML